MKKSDLPFAMKPSFISSLQEDWAKKIGYHDQSLSGAVHTLVQAGNRWSALIDKHAAPDPERPRLAHIKETLQAAERLNEEVQKSTDQAEVALIRRYGEASDAIKKAVGTDRFQGPAELEIRELLRKMDNKGRREVIEQAIADRDQEVLGAITRGKHFSIGTTPEIFNNLAADIEKRMDPENYALRESITSCLDYIREGSKASTGLARHIVDPMERKELDAAAEKSNLAKQRMADVGFQVQF